MNWKFGDDPLKAPKTFRETCRCPQCLRIGEMRFQYGNYICDYCDQTHTASTLMYFMKAFEMGREFERKL